MNEIITGKMGTRDRNACFKGKREYEVKCRCSLAVLQVLDNGLPVKLIKKDLSLDKVIHVCLVGLPTFM